MKRILNLDIDELCFAYSINDESINHYLDTTTGEIIFVSEFSMSAEELEELHEELEDEKYLPVPRIESHEAYALMENFVETVATPKIRAALIDALEGRKPFRRFKDTLSDFPDEEERWYKFQDAAHQKAILNWLAENDIAFTPKS